MEVRDHNNLDDVKRVKKKKAIGYFHSNCPFAKLKKKKD